MCVCVCVCVVMCRFVWACICACVCVCMSVHECVRMCSCACSITEEGCGTQQLFTDDAGVAAEHDTTPQLSQTCWGAGHGWEDCIFNPLAFLCFAREGGGGVMEERKRETEREEGRKKIREWGGERKRGIEGGKERRDVYTRNRERERERERVVRPELMQKGQLSDRTFPGCVVPCCVQYGGQRCFTVKW